MEEKNVVLGKSVEIQENVSIGEFPPGIEGKVEIGDDSVIRRGTIIYKNVKLFSMYDITRCSIIYIVFLFDVHFS